MELIAAGIFVIALITIGAMHFFWCREISKTLINNMDSCKKFYEEGGENWPLAVDFIGFGAGHFLSYKELQKEENKSKKDMVCSEPFSDFR